MGDKRILAAARLRGFNARCGNGLLEEPLSELDADLRVRVRLEIVRAYNPVEQNISGARKAFRSAGGAPSTANLHWLCPSSYGPLPEMLE